MKQTGLELLDPTKTAPKNLRVSCVITGHLVTALRGKEEFRMDDPSAYLQEGRAEVRMQSIQQIEESLAETLAGPLSKMYAACGRQQRRGHGLRCVMNPSYLQVRK